MCATSVNGMRRCVMLDWRGRALIKALISAVVSVVVYFALGAVLAGLGNAGAWTIAMYGGVCLWIFLSIACMVYEALEG